jgi:ribosomal protein L44E
MDSTWRPLVETFCILLWQTRVGREIERYKRERKEEMRKKIERYKREKPIQGGLFRPKLNTNGHTCNTSL